MSKTSVANKKAKAEGKLKGKKALTAASKKAKKEVSAAPKEEKAQKPSIPNYGKCVTCASYARFPDGYGHMCKNTKKPCARKSTCEKYAYKD